MISPGRATPAPGPRVVTARVTGLFAVLALVLTTGLVLLAPAPPADAADGGDSLRTTITSMTPTQLTGDRGSVTVTGEVRNDGDEAWTSVQAYLVIRGEPLTSRAGLAAAVRDDPGYAGPRVVDVGRFDEIGDLDAGDTRRFRISVPVVELPISGADGVYPVGVQILATDADGARSNDSVSRAVTLLPRMSGRQPPAPTTIVWPFLMPVGREADGSFIDPQRLVDAIAPGGRLELLLDLAEARGSDGRGIIVDPALVAAADDLAEGRGVDDISDPDRAAAADFRDRLVALGAGPDAWVLDFDRTDVLALDGDADRRRRLFGAVERSTESVVRQFDLSTRRVSWPTAGGITRSMLQSLRERGDDPAVVSSSDLREWRVEGGSRIDYPTTGGDLPLLVDDDVTRGLPGARTVATVRQRVLATAAFASLSRDADASSRADAVVVIDPQWAPPAADVAEAMSTPWTGASSTPTGLDELDGGQTYGGVVSRTTDTRPLDGQLLDAIDRASENGNLLSAASEDAAAFDDARALALADVLGVRWRSDRETGARVAGSVAAAVQRDLDSLTVMGPPSVTLSSARGGFPLTISNGSEETVSVGVRLSSSNPALDLPEQEPVQVASGDRLTVTVDVDLEQQNATTVTAQLVTPDGRPIGGTTEFNVRSSRVGAVLWITMGAAGLFVLAALARRFLVRRSARPASVIGPADD